ncbi:uncharacterized protein UV8b_02534 [Ustilaginoidea virens]|uniref:Uncharacterized protein n=1 Tax=Ustilaginoidea virens TaxID=1159556 RepID=A0A8E5HN33_USTVR|nr:uncharacterized protein UV8b_02534 [Ustilaginoidea virens]QUC18293.1 hypothetical protein UV8b_02534 [Ustilaginoidea virens]
MDGLDANYLYSLKLLSAAKDGSGTSLVIVDACRGGLRDRPFLPITRSLALDKLVDAMRSNPQAGKHTICRSRDRSYMRPWLGTFIENHLREKPIARGGWHRSIAV